MRRGLANHRFTLFVLKARSYFWRVRLRGFKRSMTKNWGYVTQTDRTNRMRVIT